MHTHTYVQYTHTYVYVQYCMQCNIAVFNLINNCMTVAFRGIALLGCSPLRIWNFFNNIYCCCCWYFRVFEQPSCAANICWVLFLFATFLVVVVVNIFVAMHAKVVVAAAVGWRRWITALLPCHKRKLQRLANLCITHTHTHTYVHVQQQTVACN